MTRPVPPPGGRTAPSPPAGAPPVLGPTAVGVGVAVGVVAVSFAAVLIRVADAPSLALAFWRCFAAAAVLAPFAARARRGAPRLRRAQGVQVAGAGVFLALHFALWISSLSYTTVASSAVLVTTAPLFVGAGAAVFLAESPSRRTWAGMGVAMLGAVGVGVADLGAAELGARALFGDALALGGAVMVAGYLLIGRSARRELPLAVYATGVYGVGAAVLAVVCVATGTPLGGYDPATWLAIGGLVVGPQLLGHTVFNWLLSTVTATVVAICVLAEPVGATLLAWLLLGELPATWFWLCAPLILVGVWLAVTKGRRGLAAG